MALLGFFIEKTPPLALLRLHFDVEGHYLKTSTLISGLQAVQNIVEGLNKYHFDGKLTVKVIALPSEEGGYLLNIALVVGIGAGVVAIVSDAIDIHESDSFKAFVEEFTEKPYEHEVVTRGISRAVRDSIGGFFLLSNKQIRKLSGDSPMLDKAIKSKTRFMRQCIKDGDVRGLGFSSDDNFRIRKEDFFKHISDVTERVESKDVLHVRGVVASSVVLEGTERQWVIRVTHVGLNQVKKSFELPAYLEDADFASDLFKGKHPVREDAEPDAIEVEILVSQVTRDGEIVNKRLRQIKKVISFKGERLVPDDYEIGSASEFYPKPDDLFSFKAEDDD